MRASSTSRVVPLISLLVLVPARGAAQDEAGEGEELYIRKGCLGCHGASARGGVGPTLANTALPFDAFLGQVRTPRGIMPAFPLDAVTDAELRSIHDYLRNVPPAAPRLRQDLPSGRLDPAGCAACHEGLHGSVVRQFETSAMGLAGPRIRASTTPCGSSAAPTVTGPITM